VKNLPPIEYVHDTTLPVGEATELHGAVGLIFFEMAEEGLAIVCAARNRSRAKTIEWQNITVYDEAHR
jgi:hypothetical protein